MKIVAVDALPAELAYVEKGLAPVLLAQPTYLWGYVGVQRIFDKVQLKKDVPQIIPMELVRVTKENLGDLGAPAQGLGLHRRAGGVSEVASQSSAVSAVSRSGPRPSRCPPCPPSACAHIVKRFPGVVALDDVSFDIAAGRCHALCGENGAGKSTLGKILAGIYAPDAGELEIFGRAGALRQSPAEALAAGIGMVHQELAFCENLSVAENLCLGRCRARGPFLARGARCGAAPRRCWRRSAPASTCTALVGELSIGQQQMLQIAAAVGRGARIIVFDEPTSSLSQHEAETLYALIGAAARRRA